MMPLWGWLLLLGLASIASWFIGVRMGANWMAKEAIRQVDEMMRRK